MSLKAEKYFKSHNKKEIKRIYTSSFAKEEQMPFFLMEGMSLLWNTQFLCFYDDDIPCGFIYMATIGKTSFVMFFAVDEKLRSKGYGSQILNMVESMHPNNKIIISIEPCDKFSSDFKLRTRRKNFYIRNGYTETGYFMKLAGVEQEILIKNGSFNKSQFIRFFLLYSNCTLIPKIWKVTD